jgi:hypothetical protein
MIYARLRANVGMVIADQDRWQVAEEIWMMDDGFGMTPT